jgi:hypothetical protein
MDGLSPNPSLNLSTLSRERELGNLQPKTGSATHRNASLPRDMDAAQVLLGCRWEASAGSGRIALFLAVSPQFNSSLARSLLRGLCDALRHIAVLLSGLLSRNRSGPLLQNARLGLGSRAHSHGVAQV